MADESIDEGRVLSSPLGIDSFDNFMFTVMPPLAGRTMTSMKTVSIKKCPPKRLSQTPCKSSLWVDEEVVVVVKEVEVISWLVLLRLHFMQLVSQVLSISTHSHRGIPTTRSWKKSSSSNINILNPMRTIELIQGTTNFLGSHKTSA